MPAYNAEKTLKQAVESILSQTYANFELIIVDDCSTDKTFDIIKELSDLDERIGYIKNAFNSGVSVSRNNGVRAARYDWIAFLDSDDCWAPNKLELQIESLRENPDCAIFFTGTAYMNEFGVLYDYILNAPPLVTYKDILKQNVVSCSSVLVRRDAMLQNPMPDSRRIHEDLATWYKILKTTKGAVGIDKPLLLYRVSASGKSGNKIEAAKMQWRTYRYCKIPFWRSVSSFIAYSVRNLKKYRKIKNNKAC